jgi:hypothetical protein
MLDWLIGPAFIGFIVGAATLLAVRLIPRARA